MLDQEEKWRCAHCLRMYSGCGTTYCSISSTSMSKLYYILNFLLLEIGTLCHVLEIINTCNAHVQLHARWTFFSFKPL